MCVKCEERPRLKTFNVYEIGLNLNDECSGINGGFKRTEANFQQKFAIFSEFWFAIRNSQV